MTLFCNNTATIEIVNNPVQHDRSNHIELNKNYIKSNLVVSVIEVTYMKSIDQLAPYIHHYLSFVCVIFMFQFEGDC